MNPDFLAGINYGLEGPHEEQVVMLTAYEIKTLHERLPVCSNEELKQIPIMPVGSRLEQGATYLDLAAPLCSAFTATADMEAGPANLYVPKSEVPYQSGIGSLGDTSLKSRCGQDARRWRQPMIIQVQEDQVYWLDEQHVPTLARWNQELLEAAHLDDALLFSTLLQKLVQFIQVEGQRWPRKVTPPDLEVPTPRRRCPRPV